MSARVDRSEPVAYCHTPWRVHQLHRAWLGEFATAVNDRLAATSGATRVSPGAAAVVTWPDVMTAAADWIASRVSADQADAVAAGALHRYQEITIVGGLKPDTELRARAVVEFVRPGPVGTELSIRSEAQALESGAAILESRSVLFLRGFYAEPEPAVGPSSDARQRAPRARMRALTIEVATHPDQVARYAEVSGDRSPVHEYGMIDRDGRLLPPVLHGMCTLAMCSAAIRDAVGADEEPYKLMCEFTAPVVPGSELEVSVWDPGAGDFTRRFEARSNGKRVLRRGAIGWHGGLPTETDP